MPDIVWLDNIETDDLRIGVDEWGGLHFEMRSECEDHIALDPNVVGKIIEARGKIV